MNKTQELNYTAYFPPSVDFILLESNVTQIICYLLVEFFSLLGKHGTVYKLTMFILHFNRFM